MQKIISCDWESVICPPSNRFPNFLRFECWLVTLEPQILTPCSSGWQGGQLWVGQMVLQQPHRLYHRTSCGEYKEMEW